MKLRGTGTKQKARSGVQLQGLTKRKEFHSINTELYKRQVRNLHVYLCNILTK